VKEVKDLYNENYEPMKKEIKEDKRMQGFPCLWISRNKIVKIYGTKKESICLSYAHEKST
jgi:hypothetical protein